MTAPAIAPAERLCFTCGFPPGGTPYVPEVGLGDEDALLCAPPIVKLTLSPEGPVDIDGDISELFRDEGRLGANDVRLD